MKNYYLIFYWFLTVRYVAGFNCNANSEWRSQGGGQCIFDCYELMLLKPEKFLPLPPPPPQFLLLPPPPTESGRLPDMTENGPGGIGQ